MKKLRKISKIVQALIIMMIIFAKKCYADLVVYPTTEEVIVSGGITIIVIGVVMAFIISTIALLVIKFSNKKNTSKIEDKSKEDFSNNYKNKINKAKRIMYITSILIVTLTYLWIWGELELPNWTVILVLIGILISIIVRVLKKRKVSNIIYAITVTVIVMILIMEWINNELIKNHNEQFYKYIEFSDYEMFPGNTVPIESTIEIEELIDATINNNNKGGNKKVIIEYNGIEYRNDNELRTLLNSIDKESRVKVVTILNDDGYVVKIILIKSKYNSELEQYKGQISGSLIKKLINTVIDNSESKSNSDELPLGGKIFPDIVYNSNGGQVKDYNIISTYKDTNISLMEELIKQIEPSHYYNVKLSYNELILIDKIIITY